MVHDSLAGWFRRTLHSLLLAVAFTHANAAASADPAGTAIANAGWAQARLNDGANLQSRTFAFPATTQKVRLYLIDTAIKQSGSWDTWFKRNPNLTIAETKRVNRNQSGITSEHATRMLSVIAGPETGVALGTPIEVIAWDVYMGTDAAPRTDSSSIIYALQQIRIHHLTAATRLPGVVCLASSSVDAAGSSGMEDTINQVVAAGLTVVISAGNSNAEASAYVPAAYGSKPGVICVGASAINNTRFTSSNFGSAVDVYAPGTQVRTLCYSAPQVEKYDLMDGSSPACALTTAAALVEVSKHPSLTPAQVEENLDAAAYRCAQTPAPLVQVASPPDVDSDGDGTADALETFFGTDSKNPSLKPPSLAVSASSGNLGISFKMAANLYDPANPYVLTNGGTWTVQYSNDLKTWKDVPGINPVAGPASGGKVPVSVTMPVSEGSTGFLRLNARLAPAP